MTEPTIDNIELWIDEPGLGQIRTVLKTQPEAKSALLQAILSSKPREKQENHGNAVSMREQGYNWALKEWEDNIRKLFE